MPRLIRAESIQSEFAHDCLFSSRLSFGVPSETLQLRRSFRNDRLTEFPPNRSRRWRGFARWAAGIFRC